MSPKKKPIAPITGRFDPLKFPKVAALDANALAIAFDKNRDNPERDELRELLATMLKSGVHVLVPALSFAEACRNKQFNAAAPRVAGISVPPFDKRCAKVLAGYPTVKAEEHNGHLPMQYWKMDQAIAACAQEKGATHLISNDKSLKRRHLPPDGIEVHWLDSYRSSQTRMEEILSPSGP